MGDLFLSIVEIVISVKATFPRFPTSLYVKKENDVKQKTDSKDLTREQLKIPEIRDDIVTRCKKGDRKAMEQLYNIYKTPLFNVAYRYTGNYAKAEELLQEIFIKAFFSMKSLKQSAALNSWLYRIAINLGISYVRKHKKELESLADTPLNVAGKDSSTIMKSQLEQAIHLLPEKQKTVFILHDIQGFHHDEIAKIVHCTTGTSKSQLFKSRMKLREYFQTRKVQQS